MSETPGYFFRLMTYNIGGGRNDRGSVFEKALEVIQKTNLDILGLQEATEWIDADQVKHNLAERIANETGANLAYAHYYGPTLSLQQHFHPAKKLFVQTLFDDFRDWSQGNALLSRWAFARLGDPDKQGAPYNLPLFRPFQYEGNRDTDPRHVILARIQSQPVQPFVIVAHLSTLVGERGKEHELIPGKAQQAQETRQKQVRLLLDMIREPLLLRGELVFLLGDFNATIDEACCRDLIEAGFVHLVPANPEAHTHPATLRTIDHIFVYPKERLIASHCYIENSEPALQASDHLPVVAEVRVV